MSKQQTKNAKEKKLDAKELAFKEQFLLTGDVVKSALNAGYAESTAKTKAFSWVSDSKCPDNKRHLLKAIREAQAERSERTKIDADWVLQQAKELHLRCMQSYPVKDRKGEQVYVEDTNGDVVPAYTFDSAGANRSLELVGKHVNVQAFKENVGITVDDIKGLSTEQLQDIVSGKYKP